jgi:PBP superfamily domain
MTETGFCTNAKCPRAERREPIERYPGPGEFCPDCGELLTVAAAPKPPAPPVRRHKEGQLIAGVFAAAAAIVIAAGAIAVPRVSALGVRVCDSSMTDRIVNEIVGAQRQNIWPYHYAVTLPGNEACDVRFGVALSGSDDAVIARDAVVAVVNPQNPVAHLDTDQLRRILTGEIADWSQLGGPRGPIVAVVPVDGSDEAAIVAGKVMLGHPYGPHDIRMAAGAEITRLVSSPSGIRAIGIVPFSLAAPAKVLALGRAPPPSPISIENERYPLAVRVLAQSDFRSPSDPASALLTLARSADANGLVRRTALITKNGT